jgi:monoamine oxidase
MESFPRHPRPPPGRVDVIVIGAGAAGVFAMRELVQSARTAVCLEARNRIGGRVFTRRSLARHPIELGAEFVHGTQTVVHQLAGEYGLTLLPHAGETYSWLEGKLHRDSDLPWPPLSALHEVRQLAERLRREGEGATPLAAFRGRPELTELLTRSAVTRRYLEQLIKNDHSVEPTVLTLEGWLESDVTGYEANFHIDEGYSALLHRAVEKAQLDIRLNRPVHLIEWEPGAVRVFARNLVLQGRAAIVTLPLGVLQQGRGIMTGQLAGECRHGHHWERRLQIQAGVQRVVRVCLQCGRSELCWSPPPAGKALRNRRKVSVPAVT